MLRFAFQFDILTAKTKNTLRILGGKKIGNSGLKFLIMDRKFFEQKGGDILVGILIFFDQLFQFICAQNQEISPLISGNSKISFSRHSVTILLN